jgi:uncharacterized small protein (TIGR04563 family)
VGISLSLIPVVRQPIVAVLSCRQAQWSNALFRLAHQKEAPLATSEKESTTNLQGSKTDKRKQSLYFPESMLQEIKEEAARLDRSLSWVVQRAWKISRMEIKKLPSVNDVEGGEDEEGG